MNQLILIQDLGMYFPTQASKQKRRFGLYRCQCGNEFKTIITSVKNKRTTSCGCIRKQKIKEMATVHSLRYHKLYSIWKGMIHRCNNINNPKYKYYGGSGIEVCNEWLSLENFINDMNPTYQDGLTLDRINIKKNYCKDNCRWADRNVQSRNTRLIKSTNTSGYRGVYLHKRDNLWVANISVNGKTLYLGRYENKIDAAKAYDNYVILNNLEHTKNFN